MIRPYLIKTPRITEKATDLTALRKYAFEVDDKATKPEVKKAVEKRYKVHVTGVNIINLHDKPKRSRGKIYHKGALKKAIVTIKEGEQIQL